jgi:protein-S-isoprenylcysteine O-methyltransferase Ste14
MALVAYMPGLLFWVLIHPFARSWRKLGPLLAYVIVGSTLVVVGAMVFQKRGVLLGRDFGTNAPFIAVGVIFFAVLAWLGLVYGRHMSHLSVASRMGVPELSNSQGPATFLRDGLYGIVRHPIYANALVAGIGYALIVNHLGTYILFVAALPVLYVVTLLEEKELTDRFGDAYRQYQWQVPRLVPRQVRKLGRRADLRK